MKYDVLTETGIEEWEGESLFQVASVFEEKNPNENYEIFESGKCPDFLTLEDYQEIYRIFGNDSACMLFNRIARRIALDYYAEKTTENLILMAFRLALTSPMDDYGTTGFDHLAHAVHFSEDHPHHEPKAFDVIDNLRKVIDMVDPYFVSEDD